jgi:Uma2 family endonuclease
MTETARPPIEYPDSDGQPMADNTLQFEWIVTLKGNLDLLFADRPDVFVAGDLLWYPVEGDNVTRAAPDAMVAFGRPKGYRGSYRQWEEGGVAPQVVFEVLSPGNRPAEMARKRDFYERFGVEEYYVYDPDGPRMEGWRRGAAGRFERVPRMDGFVSPRLGVRFDLSGPELRVLNPDGSRFLTFAELAEARRRAEESLERERRRSERERRNREAAEKRAETAEQRAARLAERLRELGIDPDAD